MLNRYFTSYPIRNPYEYFLSCSNLFNPYSAGNLNLSDIHIYTEPDMIGDGHSDDRRFNTFHCNSVDDDRVAWMIGLELTSLLRGLVTIVWGEHYQRDIYLLNMIRNDGEYVEYPNYKCGSDISIPLDLYQCMGNDLNNNLEYSERIEYLRNAKMNIFNSSLYLAQNNIGLYLILKYFSEPLTWMSLYKIMETLETLEKHHESDWKIPYSSQDRAKFTNPANNFSVLGIDSRHGFKKDSLKPNGGPKMELNEAKEMFTNAAKSYLKYKMCELQSK